MKAVGYQKSLPITDEKSLVDVDLPKPCRAAATCLSKSRPCP